MGIEWFVIGGIIVAAADQIIHNSPLKSNNILQVLMQILRTIFKVAK